MSGGHEAINNRLHEAESELEVSERTRAQIGPHRFANILQALIQKAELDNRYKASNKCGDPWPQIRAFCKEYGDLKIELANAQQDERLQVRAGALKKEIADLRQRGGGQPDDAQAALIATMTGFTEHTVKNILSFGVAFLVELGAAFGLYLSTGWLPASHAETPARGRDQAGPVFESKHQPCSRTSRCRTLQTAREYGGDRSGTDSNGGAAQNPGKAVGRRKRCKSRTEIRNRCAFKLAKMASCVLKKSRR